MKANRFSSCFCVVELSLTFWRFLESPFSRRSDCSKGKVVNKKRVTRVKLKWWCGFLRHRHGDFGLCKIGVFCLSVRCADGGLPHWAELITSLLTFWRRLEPPQKEILLLRSIFLFKRVGVLYKWIQGVVISPPPQKKKLRQQGFFKKMSAITSTAARCHHPRTGTNDTSNGVILAVSNVWNLICSR